MPPYLVPKDGNCNFLQVTFLAGKLHYCHFQLLQKRFGQLDFSERESQWQFVIQPLLEQPCGLKNTCFSERELQW